MAKRGLIAGEVIEDQLALVVAEVHVRIVADGLYSWTEFKALKKEFPGELTLVSVVTPKRLRHQRLLNRPIRPLTQAESDERDYSEIENLEKGGPIAIADHYIINEGDLENLHKQIDDTLNDIDFYKN